MNNIQKINDIKYLIMEHYSDKEPLTDNQKASRQCFLNYCDDIKNSLVRLKKLEKLEKIIKEIKDTYDKNYDIAMAAWYKSIGLTKLLEVFKDE